MKVSRICCLLFVWLCCCKEITYREPQPKGVKALNTIPQSLRGKYLLPDDNRMDRDTLVVDTTTYFAVSDKKDKRVLGDSLVLKYYKGYYFVNLNDRPEWLLRIIKQEKNGDLSYLMISAEEKEFNTLLKNLSSEIRVDSTEVNGEKLYQIDPSPKQLMNLIKKGYFKKTTTLKKIQ